MNPEIYGVHSAKCPWCHARWSINFTPLTLEQTDGQQLRVGCAVCMCCDTQIYSYYHRKRVRFTAKTDREGMKRLKLPVSLKADNVAKNPRNSLPEMWLPGPMEWDCPSCGKYVRVVFEQSELLKRDGYLTLQVGAGICPSCGVVIYHREKHHRYRWFTSGDAEAAKLFGL